MTALSIAIAFFAGAAIPVLGGAYLLWHERAEEYPLDPNNKPIAERLAAARSRLTTISNTPVLSEAQKLARLGLEESK
jgi:hypothetical protein